MLKINKRMAFVAVGAVVAIGSGSAAYAYWTGAGSGTGNSTASSGATILVHQTSSTGVLSPGTSVALAGTFENTGDAAGTVSTLTGTVAVTPDATLHVSGPACTADDYFVDGSIGSPVPVTAGTNTAGWSGLTLHMVDGAANQDNCKHALVTVTYHAS